MIRKIKLKFSFFNFMLYIFSLIEADSNLFKSNEEGDFVILTGELY